MINLICQDSIIISAESRWTLQHRKSFWWVINYSNQWSHFFLAFFPLIIYFFIWSLSSKIQLRKWVRYIVSVIQYEVYREDLKLDSFLLSFCHKLIVMKEEKLIFAKFHYGSVEERGRHAVGYIRQLSLCSVCSLLAATQRERDRHRSFTPHTTAPATLGVCQTIQYPQSSQSKW